MIVSTRATAELEREVSAGLRPRPEFLALRERHRVDLLDWEAAGIPGTGRSALRSLRHVLAALPQLDRYDVVLTDGEHVGIPMALAMRATAAPTRHVMIGHQLVTRAKKPFFSVLRAHRRIDRVVVHSAGHLEAAHRELGIPRARLAMIPYGVDTDFWRPTEATEEPLVVSAGRDHRDFATLARACGGLQCRVFVTLSSLFSNTARAAVPERWPENFDNGVLTYPSLRELYARASVVVVPMLAVDYPAGITGLLEAMAMGKAVVVSATAGLEGVVRNGETGLTVPPGDSDAMREAVSRLLDRPQERARLGANARAAVVADYRLDTFADTLAAEIAAVREGATRQAVSLAG